jgi:hypothetical protein
MQYAQYGSSSFSCSLYVRSLQNKYFCWYLVKNYFLQCIPSVAWSMIHPSVISLYTLLLSCFMKLYICSCIHTLNHLSFLKKCNSNTILLLSFRWKCTSYKDPSSSFRRSLWCCWTQEVYPVQWNSSHPNKILWEWQGIGFIVVCNLFIQYYLH